MCYKCRRLGKARASKLRPEVMVKTPPPAPSPPPLPTYIADAIAAIPEESLVASAPLTPDSMENSLNLLQAAIDQTRRTWAAEHREHKKLKYQHDRAIRSLTLLAESAAADAPMPPSASSQAENGGDAAQQPAQQAPPPAQG